MKIGYCQEQYLHDQQQIRQRKKNTKRKDYKSLYTARKHKDPSYQQEEHSRQQQYTKQSRKKHMYKRQKVHEKKTHQEVIYAI